MQFILGLHCKENNIKFVPFSKQYKAKKLDNEDGEEEQYMEGDDYDMDSNQNGNDNDDEDDEEKVDKDGEDNDDVVSVDSMSDLFPGKLFFMKYVRA